MITGEFLSKKWLTETPPEPEFCVKPLLPIGAVTLLNGHGGTGKSLFALKMAVHIALGLPIIGANTNGGNVAYMSLEDSENIVRSRIFKIVNSLPEQTRQQAIDTLTTKLMIIDRYGLQTHMAVNESGNIVTAPIACELSALIKEYSIKAVFVDTFIRTNTLNENDNAQMGALLVAFEGIAKEAGCAVVLIHHLPKGADNKAYAARGASAITDNARSAILLERVSQDDANKLAGEDIKLAVLDGRLMSVTHTKYNYSAMHPMQYLEMMQDGVLREVFPSTDSHSADEQRYMELFRWWEKEWQSKPITKTNIDEHYKSIRPENTNYGKEKYKTALDLAIETEYAKKIPAPEGASKNPKAEYYELSSLE